MARFGPDVYQAWIRGTLSSAELLLFESAIRSSQEEAEAFNRWITEESAGLESPSSPAECEQLGAEAVEAALALVRRQERQERQERAKRERRPRLVPIALAACLGALVGVGTTWLVQQRSEFEAVTDQLCFNYHREASVVLQPALGCGAAAIGTLGPGGPDLSEPRIILEARARPNAPEWLAARSLAALLEGNPEDVLDLLSGRAELLDAHPRLRSDLAAALLLQGDLDGARAQLERAVELAPDDPLLRANLQVLE